MERWLSPNLNYDQTPNRSPTQRPEILPPRPIPMWERIEVRGGLAIKYSLAVSALGNSNLSNAKLVKFALAEDF